MTPEKFKRLRLSRNYSQTQLAMKLGVTQRTISHWENEARPIRTKYKKKLKEIFKVKKVARKPRRVKRSPEEVERQHKQRVELMRRMDEKTDVPGKMTGNWHLLPDDDEDLVALRELMGGK